MRVHSDTIYGDYDTHTQIPDDYIWTQKINFKTTKTQFRGIHTTIHVNFPLEGKGNGTGEEPKEDFSINMRERTKRPNVNCDISIYSYACINIYMKNYSKTYKYSPNTCYIPNDFLYILL